jgi:phage tail-like protein
MPLINPVPVFNFHVLLSDARFGLIPKSPLEFAQLGVTILKGAVFGGSFSSVEGLDGEVEVESYREGGNNGAPRRFKTRVKTHKLVLRRGITPNPDLWDWAWQVVWGNRAPLRKDGWIILNDRGPLDIGGFKLGGLTSNPNVPKIPFVNAMPVAAWNFKNGLPEKLVGPGLDAKRNQMAIETLEISHQGLTRLGFTKIPGAGEALAELGL